MTFSNAPLSLVEVEVQGWLRSGRVLDTRGTTRWTATGTLHHDYVRWMRSLGRTPATHADWSFALSLLGYEHRTRQGAKVRPLVLAS